jgi:hypothetical protein
MNPREVPLPFKVSSGHIAPRTTLPTFVVSMHFETNRVCIAGEFMPLKPANGAQSE